MYQQQLANILQKVKKEEHNLYTTKSKNLIKESDKIILFLSDKLNELKIEVLKNDFKSEQEEIYFFKEIKPRILGEILFYKSLIDIEILYSKGNTNTEQQIMCYKTQINKILKDLDNEFYRYILLGRKDKDNFYFLRKNINYNELKSVHKDFFLN